MHNHDPNFYRHLRAEFSDGWRWVDRVVVLAFGGLAGLVVVMFTMLSQWAFDFFLHLQARTSVWLMLLWTPMVTLAVVWCTRRLAPMAAGSGIPQVMASLSDRLDDSGRNHFVSVKLAVAKVLLGVMGLLGGLSLGREGPSVQVAAGVMLHCRRWIHGRRAMVGPHALLVAGGAAGIAAAFNAPLAGVVFALEELARKLEMRFSGVIIASIVLAGLMGVSAFGNGAYFGSVAVPSLGWWTVLPALLVAVVCGLAGGLLAKLLIVTLIGASNDRFTVWRRTYPMRFAAGLGVAVALIGIATGGMTFGSGTEAARELLEGKTEASAGFFGLLKYFATWLTAWSGAPGGLFAPSLSIGAGFGYNVSTLLGYGVNTALIAMGMAAFLAAVTQAPLTAFIIVMEMIDGRPMVLSLMAVTMISATISRTISRPLYGTLAARMLESFSAYQEGSAFGEVEPAEASTKTAPSAETTTALSEPVAANLSSTTEPPAPTSSQTPPSDPAS